MSYVSLDFRLRYQAESQVLGVHFITVLSIENASVALNFFSYSVNVELK